MLGSEGGGLVSREDIMRRLELLRVEHRDLDSAIAALIDAGGSEAEVQARIIAAAKSQFPKHL